MAASTILRHVLSAPPKVGLLAIFAAFSVVPATGHAHTPRCGDATEIADQLIKRYRERVLVVAQMGGEIPMEIWVSEDFTTFSIVTLRGDMRCLEMSGQTVQINESAPPEPGNDS